MLRQLAINPVNGVQTFPLSSGVQGLAQIIIASIIAPGAGTVTIDYQASGSGVWARAQGGTTQPLTAPVALQMYGGIAQVRVTIAGLVGGQGITAFVQDIDAQGFPPNAFAGLRALNTQSYVESNVKLGAQFYIQYSLPLLAAGVTHKIAFNTGAKPVLIKGRDLYAAGANITYQLFKAPTGVTGGTAIPVQNYNDINAALTTVTCSGGVTTTADGTSWGDPSPLYGSTLVGGRVGSGLAPGGDRVLKPNASYLVSVKNADTAALMVPPAWSLTWYEGNPDLPLT